MSDPAGRLRIQLQRTPQGLGCEIASTRPTDAAALFIGRAPVQTAGLLPVLFSVCAKAQASACATALEQAEALTPAPHIPVQRRLAVATESLREHLWRILLDWPGFLDAAPNRAAMTQVMSGAKGLQGLLDPDGTLFRPGSSGPALDAEAARSVLAALDALVARHLLGMPSARWLDVLHEEGGWTQWFESTETAAARLLRHLVESGEASLGQTAVPPVPGIPDPLLAERLGGTDAASFTARPVWNGIPHETSPFTRCAELDPLQVLITVHGKGLLARLAAQILEVALGLARLDRGLTAREWPEPQARPDAIPPGIGIGRAAAARGLLVHRVQVRDQQVVDYRILAPTDWNFHPQGVVAQALAGLPDTADDRLGRRAELLIMAIDPCVAFDLLIEPRPA